MVEEGESKWWHVADSEVEAIVARNGICSAKPIRYQPTVVSAATRPPRPWVANSPRPQSTACEDVESVDQDINIVTAVSRPPRPRVMPGTPLMSYRSSSRQTSTPSSRPCSASRRSSSKRDNGNIVVYVYNVHSSDKLVLRVHPDIAIGPPTPQEGSICTVSTPSLKQVIANTLAVDVERVRLMWHGIPLSCNEETLCSRGIGDGETLHLRLRRQSSVDREVVLSSAARASAQELENQEESMVGMRPYALQPSSARRQLDERCRQNDVSVMPKWISQAHPKLFAPVGGGMDNHGNARPYEEFRSLGIWTPPVDHPNQRGQNQYGIQRVREAISARGGA